MKDLQHEPDYFGGCPECGQTGQCMNVNRDHWFVCDEHKTKWWVGSNLFSCWRDEDEAIWKKNSEKLLGYIDVRPRYFQTAFEESVFVNKVVASIDHAALDSCSFSA